MKLLRRLLHRHVDETVDVREGVDDEARLAEAARASRAAERRLDLLEARVAIATRRRTERS